MFLLKLLSGNLFNDTTGKSPSEKVDYYAKKYNGQMRYIERFNNEHPNDAEIFKRRNESVIRKTKCDYDKALAEYEASLIRK